MNPVLHSLAIPGEIIPVIAIVATFSVPIVAILVHHQRKMAELIHRQHPQPMMMTPEVEALRREVSELKQMVQQQTIAIDDVRALAQRNAPGGPEVSNRLT